ncbi:MAG: ATP-binding protein, partial [Defluviitaleaceae bacterium]|nr:ATP-binding protein [Defluviitaleaceae bacterium]
MGSALACLLGGVFLYFTVRSFTKPIESIIGQLKGSDGNTIVAQKATAYEIDMLCYTINDMTERRLFAERQIREERQRYMLALESSSDTFLEYDAVGDALSIYYFTQRLQQSPEHRTIPNFMRLVANQEFFHPDDNYNLFNDKNHEVRVKTTFFSHIQDSDAENGYFWLSIKTITIYDNEGRPEKVIGTAREITREKAKEFAAIETSRRDLTTGFLNITHGLELVQQSIKAAFDGQKPFVMSLVCINNFDRLEVTYGRIFGGIFMAEFSNVISRIIGTQGFVVRMGNDEFLIYHELTWEEAQAKDDLIQEAFDALYTGEETDFELSLSIEPVEGDYKFADAKSDKPVNVSFDPNDKEGLGNLVLELFERTSHIGSSVRMLLRLVGRLFALDSIVVCTYDPSFGTNQVAHQWHTEDGKVYSSDIKKVSQAGFDSLMYLLNEDDVMIYASAEVVEDPINALLCISPGESVSIYCCAGHEHAVIVGSMLFISGNSSRVWVDKEQDILQNIAKIIATYMNVEKSRSASRAKSRFLSRVSHEIRTPMNAIIGMTNIAMEATKTDNHARLDDCLNKINVAARYLLSLINDVLEMARIESGKLLQIENRSFSMRSFVQDIEAVIRFAIESNGIEFRVVSTFNHDRIISDEYRLKQVIINLLGNANKFTRPGGVITLSIEYIGTAVSEGGTQQARVRFSVKDNGIGIPFGKQASIFKPFEQADTPSLNNQQGTGLGLSISANIITALGSTIELESEPGKGSEFSFVLDLLLDEAVAVATGLSEPDEYAYPPDHFKGKRVLLVDDVDINIEIVEFILDGVGFTVETATNGKEAVDKFFAAPQGYYDVILMDIQMPVMDGITAARAIRGNYERPDAQTIPIIALTANAFDEDLKKSVESGMDNHITKPVNEKELLALLKRKL